tara:strand:- start:455 stop:892 length:438 start_codon:yes stop_codon:yes gene_type:complete
MDLASKMLIVESLVKIREQYRNDTDTGKSIREGVSECINHIVSAYPNQLFSLKLLGESDLNNLLEKAKSELDKLTEEPKVKVFKIGGQYISRYTKCHEKAKLILKEEFNDSLENVEGDYADFKIHIETIDIKQSNLKDYKIEIIK